jgi:hypothetical protein
MYTLADASSLQRLKAAVLVMCCVQRHGSYLHELLLTVGCLATASRICSSICRKRTQTERKARRFDTPQLLYLSLCLITASAAFPFHYPDAVCMSANSAKEYPLCILDQQVTRLPRLTLLQTDSKCDTR